MYVHNYSFRIRSIIIYTYIHGIRRDSLVPTLVAIRLTHQMIYNVQILALPKVRTIAACILHNTYNYVVIIMNAHICRIMLYLYILCIFGRGEKRVISTLSILLPQILKTEFNSEVVNR